MFFATMGQTMKSSPGGRWKKAGDALIRVGKFMAVASSGLSIAGVSFGVEKAGTAAKAARDADELAKMLDSGEQTLRSARETLETQLDALGEAGSRVVVLIDDVDRLDRAELLELLRLLRVVADLPAVTLLVAMDERRVREVLEEAVTVGYGRAYLEKIVQAMGTCLSRTRLSSIPFCARASRTSAGARVRSSRPCFRPAGRQRSGCGN